MSSGFPFTIKKYFKQNMVIPKLQDKIVIETSLTYIKNYVRNVGSKFQNPQEKITNKKLID